MAAPTPTKIAPSRKIVRLDGGEGAMREIVWCVCVCVEWFKGLPSSSNVNILVYSGFF